MKSLPPQTYAVLRRGLLFFTCLCSGAFLACLAIHFFVRDALAGAAFVFYAMPLPILAGISLLLGLLWRLSQRRRMAQLCFVFTFGALVSWSYESFSLNTKTAAPDSVKLFFWNAASNREAAEVANYIASFQADVIGIVEAGMRSKKVSAWQDIFPDYHVEKLGGNMALITKGKILSQETGSLGGRGRFNLLEVDLKEGRVYVLLVDLDSDPYRSRLPAFAPLLQIIRAHAQTNLIVMGDFNTPLGSIFFEAFHPYLNHAFERGGNGFAESWPLPLPLLMIDHIWVSKKINVVNCNLNWSRLSDHRAVLANIELPFHSVSENLVR